MLPCASYPATCGSPENGNVRRRTDGKSACRYTSRGCRDRRRCVNGMQAAERVRLWRRRALLRRGVRMHAVMGPDAVNCSLAMLDEQGFVVAWYDRADGNDRVPGRVVDHHVSQFYVPEDITHQQPLRDLHAATVEHSNTRQGWRRHPDGVRFWGTSVIQAVLLRDGRLQGFSYVTRGCEGPEVGVPMASSAAAQDPHRPHSPPEPRRDQADGDWRPARILPAWDRMARSRSTARHRRLFRLACRIRVPERGASRWPAS
jgi:hypothetical protein